LSPFPQGLEWNQESTFLIRKEARCEIAGFIAPLTSLISILVKCAAFVPRSIAVTRRNPVENDIEYEYQLTKGLQVPPQEDIQDEDFKQRLERLVE
jgi:hypothetical protein